MGYGDRERDCQITRELSYPKYRLTAREAFGKIAYGRLKWAKRLRPEASFFNRGVDEQRKQAIIASTEALPRWVLICDLSLI